jgi:aminoglycoside phosphotransferase (APT) family kinase protein
MVGEVICAIHRKSAGNPTLAKRFSNDDTFELIRLSPYFRATAEAHPSLAPQLTALAERTLSTKLALVHGDVSPKNILCGPKGPVLLDAECAWYGDPAFDLAFCLNHLLLKAVWHPQWTRGYMQSFLELSHAYLNGVDWESVAAFENRCAALLPALALSRVDGKSPAEYLTEPVQIECVRNWATALILNPVDTLDAVGAAFLQSAHV